jgi:hypothetical protein
MSVFKSQGVSEICIIQGLNMTDRQMLLSIKIKASKRPSNYQLVAMIDELMDQALSITLLEKNVMEHLLTVCKIYDVKLDTDELKQMNLQFRIEEVLDKSRISKLHKAGFGIGQIK